MNPGQVLTTELDFPLRGSHSVISSGSQGFLGASVQGWWLLPPLSMLVFTFLVWTGSTLFMRGLCLSSYGPPLQWCGVWGKQGGVPCYFYFYFALCILIMYVEPHPPCSSLCLESFFNLPRQFYFYFCVIYIHITLCISIKSRNHIWVKTHDLFLRVPLFS